MLLTFAKAALQLHYQPGVLPAYMGDMKYTTRFTQNGHLLEKLGKKKHEDSVGSLVSPSTNTSSFPHYHVPPARLLLMTAGISPRWKKRKPVAREQNGAQMKAKFAVHPPVTALSGPQGKLVPIAQHLGVLLKHS